MKIALLAIILPLAECSVYAPDAGHKVVPGQVKCTFIENSGSWLAPNVK
jgi:hypothetical protein